MSGAPPPPQAARADAARRCRLGLATAGRALLGPDLTATALALRDRANAGGEPWPWLPGAAYRALEPLAVAFPDDDRAAVVAGRLLVGLPARPDRIERALEALRADPAPPPAAQAPDPALADAVEGFWQALAHALADVGDAVRDGEESDVDAALDRARRRARRAAGPVRHAAAAVAEPASATPAPEPATAREPPEPAGAPELERVARETEPEAAAGPQQPEPAVAQPERVAPEPVAPDPTGPAGPPSGDVAAAASARETLPEGEPLPEDDRAIGPERPYAPLVFVGATVVLALLLILAVLIGLPLLG